MSELFGRIEALVLASDEPLTLARLRELLAGDAEQELATGELRAVLAELESFYGGRGIRFVQVGGGWQFRTAAEHKTVVQRLWESKPPKLGRSLLETLAIIAYRQPTTRAEIEALRGVKVSSSIISTLQERGWIKVVGRKEVPGRPHLFGTSRQFLVDFGLGSLKDLPETAQLLDEEELLASHQTPLFAGQSAAENDEGEERSDRSD